MSRGVPLLVFLLCCSAPAPDVSTPQGAYGAWLAAMGSSAKSGLYDLLQPEWQLKLDAAHAEISEASRIISASYPEGDRVSALVAAGADLIRDAPDGRAVLARLLRDEMSGLAGRQRLGARVLSVDVVGDQATVRTFAGDIVMLARAGERWAVVPSEQLRTAINTLSARSRGALAEVRARAAELDSLRAGRVVPTKAN